jgi:hypothetical protein
VCVYTKNKKMIISPIQIPPLPKRGRKKKGPKITPEELETKIPSVYDYFNDDFDNSELLTFEPQKTMGLDQMADAYEFIKSLYKKNQNIELDQTFHIFKYFIDVEGFRSDYDICNPINTWEDLLIEITHAPYFELFDCTNEYLTNLGYRNPNSFLNFYTAIRTVGMLK